LILRRQQLLSKTYLPFVAFSFEKKVLRQKSVSTFEVRPQQQQQQPVATVAVEFVVKTKS
jgi:hypothetical protein